MSFQRPSDREIACFAVIGSLICPVIWMSVYTASRSSASLMMKMMAFLQLNRPHPPPPLPPHPRLLQLHSTVAVVPFAVILFMLSVVPEVAVPLAVVVVQDIECRRSDGCV
jgi:hypothetical protein